MLKKSVLLLAAACSFILPEVVEAAPKSSTKNVANAKAKGKKKPFVIPADGGLKNSTTPTARFKPRKPETHLWSKRYADKMKQIAEYKNDVEIIFIGDSITHFWERDGKKSKKGIGGLDTYNKYFKDYRLINFGYSGDRTEHTLWIISQSTWLDNIKPKMAVVMIGTNNIGHRRATAAATAAGITRIVKTLQEKLPDTKIVLFGVFPRAGLPTHEFRKQIKEINAVISKLADDKQVFYCDITDKLLTENGRISKNIMPDFLHPNDNGYEIWAQAIMPYVEKFVGKKDAR